MNPTNLGTEYCYIYRTGTPEECKWVRVGPLSLSWAQTMAKATESMGFKCLIENHKLSVSIGLPESWEPNSILDNERDIPRTNPAPNKSSVEKSGRGSSRLLLSGPRLRGVRVLFYVQRFFRLFRLEEKKCTSHTNRG